MKKTTKALLLSLCAVALVVASVMGTLAYLTSTDEVINTFAVGDVGITLDEAPVDADGQATTGSRVKANEYKLIPGHSYDKDPTVHVDDDSEDCWIFVKVVDEIAEIQAADTVATQMAEKGWALVEGETDVYAYNTVVSGGANIVVFETFTVKGELTNAQIAAYKGKTITVTAYAVQADGFDSAADAWTAASGQFGD